MDSLGTYILAGFNMEHSQDPHAWIFVQLFPSTSNTTLSVLSSTSTAIHYFKFVDFQNSEVFLSEQGIFGKLLWGAAFVQTLVPLRNTPQKPTLTNNRFQQINCHGSKGCIHSEVNVFASAERGRCNDVVSCSANPSACLPRQVGSCRA